MSEFETLDWQILLTNLVQFATSDAAKNHLKELSPLASPSDCIDSFEQIEEVRNLLTQGTRPFMESLDLFDTWFRRLEKDAVLKTLELKDVRHFLLEVLALAELIRPVETGWLSHIQLVDAERPLAAIDSIMTPSGEIRSDASETLYKLYREKDQAIRSIQNTLDKLIKDHDMDSILQDRYVTNREGRWVLPVKSGMQHQFDGIIHAASQSKQTVFMEPEAVIPLNNRVRQIEVEIEEEIERLLTELSVYLATLKDELKSSRTILQRTDIRFAQAQLADQVEARPIQFSQEHIQLNNLKHPILIINGDDVIANSVELDNSRRILLLSGPNAGGKTVLLKSIGLAAQMARCGLPVCSGAESSMPFFNQIHVGVGDAQSVDEQMSTFAAHLKVLNSATEAKGSGHLLLIDEICGSTDPQEGSALARSFIEAYAHNNVYGVVTSHLGPLKGGWEDSSGVMNGSMEYDSENGIPTYQFVMGIPGDSLALQTAKRVGVSETILARTLELLDPETRKRHNIAAEVEELKAQLISARTELKDKIAASQQEKSKYESLILNFEKEKSDLLKNEIRKAENKIEELIKGAEVDQLFKRHTRLEEAREKLPDIVKASNKPKESAIESAEEFGKKFPPGSRVFVNSINQDAIVQSEPNTKGEISILSNSIRLSVPWTDLKPPRQNQNPTAKIIRQTGKFDVALHENQRVVDLRGKTVDVALQELEVELDQAATHQEDRVKVIHGHGTEALKKAIRTYLSRCVYVTKWTAGGKESGGDGVTWIELS